MIDIPFNIDFIKIRSKNKQLFLVSFVFYLKGRKKLKKNKKKEQEQ